MTQLTNYKVSRNVGRNPVARAIERKRLQRWLSDVTTEVYLREEGDECGALLKTAAEAIGAAIKSIEGFDDLHDVGGLMVDAMADLARMANDGRKWRKECADRLAEALDCAVQILAESDPRTKLKAWHWAQQFAQGAAA